MELGKRISQIIKNNSELKDLFLFALVTIVFHFLYWGTDMNIWLFWPFNNEVYGFFTSLTYKGTVLLSNIFFTTPFDAVDSSIKFYKITPSGAKLFFSTMEIVKDCSGVKQILQLFMIMLVVPNKFWKRMIYFLCSSIVVLLFNIIRIFSLTYVMLHYPENYKFIHDWIGRPYHYIIIFVIWVIWLQFFARPRNNNLMKNPKE